MPQTTSPRTSCCLQALLGDAAPNAAAGLLANEQLPRWPEAVANAASVPDTATPAPPAPLPVSATQRPQSSEPTQTAQHATAADPALAGSSPPANGAATELGDQPLHDPGLAGGTAGAEQLTPLDTVCLRLPLLAPEVRPTTQCPDRCSRLALMLRAGEAAGG